MEYQSNFFQILEESVKLEAAPKSVTSEEDVCPICGDELTRNGRCKTCYTCGWSSCDI